MLFQSPWRKAEQCLFGIISIRLDPFILVFQSPWSKAKEWLFGIISIRLNSFIVVRGGKERIEFCAVAGGGEYFI